VTAEDSAEEMVLPASRHQGAFAEPVELEPGAGEEQLLASMVTIATGEDVVDAVLRLLVTLAAGVVAGADGASVTLRREGELATVAASNQTISAMDAAQYATGEGPCLDASMSGVVTHVDSMVTELRWPSFTERAAALGITAVVSTPLYAGGQPVGALNIYSSESGFDGRDRALATLFASEASAMLSQPSGYTSQVELITRIQRALATRRVIAQAEGIVMEREGIGGDEAYSLLRQISLAEGMTLSEQADGVVGSAGGATPTSRVGTAADG
jgi:GAF domain-containing protein